MFTRRLIFAAAAAFAATALTASSSAQSNPPPTPMNIVIYKAGPAWAAGKPSAEQALGPHLDYVGGLFKAGKVVAYGTQTDAVRGFYILSGADASTADEFVNHHPGVKDHVLTSEAKLKWAVVVNGFAAKDAGASYFLLRYAPGPQWKMGKPMTEQAIGAHFNYMIEQAKKGVVLAAGPSLEGDEGLYVVRGDKAEVDALIAADPGVTSGVFAPKAFGWNVIAMQSAR